ncbi:MAG: sulfatase-like hydrolase/transferase [bacterium]|nr:sulfatase-like hydrolase/transferase [bacterium]
MLSLCQRLPIYLVIVALFVVFTPVSVFARKPNVVIFLTDDQGTLDANCFGAADLKTPAIDKLATTGVRFTQAYAHVVCCPTRAALLTGRHPQRCGVNVWTQGNLHSKSGNNMALSEVTIAETLKAAGYRTALFGKWHLGAAANSGPTKQGFDQFFGIRGGFIDNHNHHFLHQRGYHDLYEGVEEIERPGKFFPSLVVQRAVTFITENQDKPFFLYLPLNTPHYPEQPPKKFLDMYPGLKEPRRTYAAFVTMTDSHIKTVMDQIELLGLREDTIVIFMSDNGHSTEDNQISVDGHRSGLPRGHNYGANGGGGFTGKWIGHKATFLEGGIRVPAIISAPSKLPTGIVRNQIVTAMDWYPTLCELCDLPPTSHKLDGQSLVPIIQSSDAKSAHAVLHFQWINSWAVREGPWKLICRQGRGEQARAHYTLRNLDDKQPEVVDHAAENEAVVARLKKLHEQWAQDVFLAN